MNIILGGCLTGHKPLSFSLSEELNAGWTGRLDFPYLINHESFAADDTATMTLSDDVGSGVSLTSPDMILRSRKRTTSTGQERTSFDLIDETSLKLSGGSESFNTFEDVTSVDIAEAIADRFGVSVSGLTEFPVWKHDVKLSTGWAPLQLLALVTGQQLRVTTSGDVQFVGNSWTIPGGPFKADSEDEEQRPGEIIGKLFVSKNLGTGSLTGPWYFDFNEDGYPSTALDPPISNAFPTDVTSIDGGSISWVAFWDSEDRLIAIHRLSSPDEAPAGYSVPINGSWPAVRFTCLVTAPSSGDVFARLQVAGTPPSSPPDGVDTAFSVLIGTGRGLTVPFQEALIPSRAWALAKGADWLTEMNRGKRVLTASGPMDCSARVGIVHSSSRLGLTGRAEKATWSGSPGGVCRSSIECEIGV